MNRHHCHLSKDIETASIVGSRRGNFEILEIEAMRMSADGYKIYMSDNGVYLVDEIPSKYIKKTKIMKKSFINWCRNCHFDWLISIKEIKGKKWMCILSHIENKGEFTIDDYMKIEESWKKILQTINQMTIEEINHLSNLRRNI